MASNPYVKSLIWLVSAGGGAYLLMRITEPSAEKIEKIRASSNSTLTETEKNKLLFMMRLKEAANQQPIYLKKKDE